MCYFVTLGIPARDQQVIEQLKEDGFHIEPVSNPHVAELFPSDHAVFTVTRGGCSCSFYAETAPASGRTDESVSLVRYRRKGWSAAKISRALDASRRSARVADQGQAQFADTVSRLVREIGGVCLFAHMYSGPIATEPLGPSAVLRLPLDMFRRHTGAFPADTLVYVDGTSV